MYPEKIENHIDNRIIETLRQGILLSEIKDDLKNKIETFKKRKNFISVKKKYLINNWDRININKKYTTYYVIHSSKRKNDIDWLIKNKNKFNVQNDVDLFKILKLKEKINNFIKD